MYDIKSRRLALNMTLEEVGEIVGVGKSTVRKWENGMIDNMKRDKIALLAKALKISPLVLLSEDSTVGENEQNITYIYNQLTPPRQTKVYDFAEHQLKEQNNVIEVDLNDDSISIVRGRRSAAGLTIVGDDSGAYEEVLSASMIPKGADELVEITGSSMEPLIEKGTEVFLRYQPTIENGEIAIVRIENEGVTCKRVYFDDGTITLKSENPEYEDMHFDPSQVTVLGKVLL